MSWTKWATCVLGLCVFTGCGMNLTWRGASNQGGGPVPVVPPVPGPGPVGGLTGASYPLTGPVSSWVGVNADADIPYCDLAHFFNAFTAPSVDANGWPNAGTNGQMKDDVGFDLPTGDYLVSYVGTGALTATGIGSFTGAWQTVNGEQRNTLHINGTPGAFGNFLYLNIVNGPGQTVTDVHVYFQGCQYDDPHLFNSNYIHLLSPFRALRYMSYWLGTIGNSQVNWEDRTQVKTWGQTSTGQPYEYIVQLINQTGKDAWINIPEQASDEYVTGLADFLRSNLDFANIAQVRQAQGMTAPFQIIVEFSNEVMFSNATVYQELLADANANPTRYPGTYTGNVPFPWGGSWVDEIKVEQVYADKLVHFTQIMKTELSAINQQGIIKPALLGWQLTAVLNDIQLRFISTNYGTPSNYVTYSGFSSYFGPPSGSNNSTMASYFGNLTTSINGNASVFSDQATVLSNYNIEMAAYEGGDGSAGSVLEHIALYDSRMATAYNQMFAFWQQYFGKSLLNQYSLEETGGMPQNIWQYGEWGAVDSILQDPSQCTLNIPQFDGNELPYSPTVRAYCPKYKALLDQATQ